MKRVTRICLLITIMSMGIINLAGCSSYNFFNPFHRHHYTKPGHTPPSVYKATMRSYSVGGKTYQPTYVSVGDSMSGVASWYGSDFHGRPTSNGERYNMYSMTVAHKTWPMDTMVRVDNLDNGRSCIARINDRGPFVKNRILDCSYAVGKKLGFSNRGTTRVRVTVLGFAGKIYHPSKAKRGYIPRIRLKNFGIQVGAFHQYAGAQTYQRAFTSRIRPPKYVKVRKFIVNGSPLYRVWIMGFASEDEARDYINEQGISGGFLIRDRY